MIRGVVEMPALGLVEMVRKGSRDNNIDNFLRLGFIGKTVICEGSGVGVREG